MSIDVKAQLQQEVEKRGFDDFYIDSNEEREILQIAIHLGMPMAQGRELLLEVAQQVGYILETELLKQLREQLPVVLRGRKKLNQRGFQQVVQHGVQYAAGHASEADIQRLLISLLEEVGSVPVRNGLFKDWYGRLKQSLRKPRP